MMKFSIFVAVIFAAGMAQQQSCYPAQEQHNAEQSALCKAQSGLPIMVYDVELHMAVYRGCQIPCQPAVVHPDVEPK